MTGRRVLITGGAGLLGRALLRQAPAGWELHATQRAQPVSGAHAWQLELSDAVAVAQAFAKLEPELVIHTAYSAAQGERDIVAATQNVVTGCVAARSRLIHISTDLVFDGEQAPYAESAAPAPISEYGRWKHHAEKLVGARLPDAAIVRTSLVTEPAPPDPRVAWVADSVRHRQPITLYMDELRCPIASADLATQLWQVAELPAEHAGGVWHLAGPEALSRYALGVLIAMRFGLDPSRITPGRSREANPPRPRDVRLLTTRADRALRCRPRPISEMFADADEPQYACAP